MLKLSRELYFINGEKKYLDYYEKTYINSILASQNPNTGMMQYFQPMGAGYNKVYNRPYEDFWCCTGTGIESFSKLADTFYIKEKNFLLINLYFSNVLELPESNHRLFVEVDRKKMKIRIKVESLNEVSNQSLSLAFRIPDWSHGWCLEGNEAATLKNGLLLIETPLHVGEEIILQLMPELVLNTSPDNSNYAAFGYGPYILAAQLGTKNLSRENPNGILVRVGTKESSLPDTIALSKKDWQLNLTDVMQENDQGSHLITFQLNTSEERLNFVPYYELHDERYGIYFTITDSADTKVYEKKVSKENNVFAELSTFDGNNSEYSKRLTYDNSIIGDFQGRSFRMAEKQGWFRYYFGELNAQQIYLTLIFHSSDSGKKLVICGNGLNQEIIVSNPPTIGFFKQEIQIYLKEAGYANIDICFKAMNERTPRIFGIEISK